MRAVLERQGFARPEVGEERCLCPALETEPMFPTVRGMDPSIGDEICFDAAQAQLLCVVRCRNEAGKPVMAAAPLRFALARELSELVEDGTYRELTDKNWPLFFGRAGEKRVISPAVLPTHASESEEDLPLERVGSD